MREEYNNVLSTPTEADKIGRFGRYRYIGKTQISANYIGLSLELSIAHNNNIFSFHLPKIATGFAGLFHSRKNFVYAVVTFFHARLEMTEELTFHLGELGSSLLQQLLQFINLFKPIPAEMLSSLQALRRKRNANQVGLQEKKVQATFPINPLFFKKFLFNLYVHNNRSLPRFYTKPLPNLPVASRVDSCSNNHGFNQVTK